jgi:hypothetical protein
VARLGRRDPLRADDIAQRETPAIANLGIAYVPESMGIFAGPHGARKPDPRARAGPPDEQRLDWIFRFFPPMKKFWELPAGLLSGGQKQMLSISRAIVEPRQAGAHRRADQGPRAGIINNLIEAFAELKKTDTTILMVEQNSRREIARRFGGGDGRGAHRARRAHGRARGGRRAADRLLGCRWRRTPVKAIEGSASTGFRPRCCSPSRWALAMIGKPSTWVTLTVAGLAMGCSSSSWLRA